MKDIIKKILKESEDFDWVKDIEAGINIEPNTLYYFEPNLTVSELRNFANSIVNAPRFKNWLLTLPNVTDSLREDGGMKYVITKYTLPIEVAVWCTSTSVERAKKLYPGVQIINGRKMLGF